MSRSNGVPDCLATHSNDGGRGVNAPSRVADGSSYRLSAAKRRSRWLASGAALALSCGGMLTIGGYPADASASIPASVVKHCTYTALATAIRTGGTITFGCSGTIVIPKTFTIDPAMKVTLDAQGRKVALDAAGNGRLFMVRGGHLTLKFLTLENSLVAGANGKSGASGPDGDDGDNGSDGENAKDGANGEDGESGKPGGSGGIATAGTAGDGAQGGALYITRGSVVTISHSTFTHNVVVGGNGGRGGDGGMGGDGGDAGDGSNGGSGGAAGQGAPGGNAQGGAVYNAGTLTVTSSTFANNGAVAGNGGAGGDGGMGGNAGDGGTGGNGGIGCAQAGAGGAAGEPGMAGPSGGAGAGGNGGAADGGGIYNTGTLTVTSSKFAVEITEAGAAGAGGAGGIGVGRET